jgi:hypothetical protein
LRAQLLPGVPGVFLPELPERRRGERGQGDRAPALRHLQKHHRIGQAEHRDSRAGFAADSRPAGNKLVMGKIGG